MSGRMPGRTRVRGALALLGLACLVACRAPARRQAPGDSTRVAASSAEALACTLIGIPELERITGASLTPGPRTEDYQGYSRCDWRRGGLAFLALVVNQRGDFRGYMEVPGAQPVSDVGESAVWNPRTQQLGVQLRQGTISVNFLAAPFEKKWAEEIARAVLRRLQTPEATSSGTATSSTAGSGAAVGASK